MKIREILPLAATLLRDGVVHRNPLHSLEKLQKKNSEAITSIVREPTEADPEESLSNSFDELNKSIEALRSTTKALLEESDQSDDC